MHDCTHYNLGAKYFLYDSKVMKATVADLLPIQTALPVAT